MNIREITPDRSFRVTPAANGGWVVMIEDRSLRDGSMMPMSAAVTSDEDLIEWLRNQLGVY